MSDSFKLPDPQPTAGDPLAVLSRDFPIHVLNCSSSGCLFESRSPLEVGTVGALRLIWLGEEFVEDVRVVRCQPIRGAGTLYQLGVEFLWTHPPAVKSLRHAMQRLVDPSKASKGQTPF
jgi:hypothetical protein